MQKLKYTIAFLKRKDEILLLNRENSSWMGCWNGVGGKVQGQETPMQCIIREIKEETGIYIAHPEYKGIVSWMVNGEDHGGMHAFTVELPDNFEYFTPIKTEEGILDWKRIEWILHPENYGVANLHYFLPIMLTDQTQYNHQFVYENDDVRNFTSLPIKHFLNTGATS